MFGTLLAFFASFPSHALHYAQLTEDLTDLFEVVPATLTSPPQLLPKEGTLEDTLREFAARRSTDTQDGYGTVINGVTVRWDKHKVETTAVGQIGITASDSSLLRVNSLHGGCALYAAGAEGTGGDAHILGSSNSLALALGGSGSTQRRTGGRAKVELDSGQATAIGGSGSLPEDAGGEADAEILFSGLHGTFVVAVAGSGGQMLVEVGNLFPERPARGAQARARASSGLILARGGDAGQYGRTTGAKGGKGTAIIGWGPGIAHAMGGKGGDVKGPEAREGGEGGTGRAISESSPGPGPDVIVRADGGLGGGAAPYDPGLPPPNFRPSVVTAANGAKGGFARAESDNSYSGQAIATGGTGGPGAGGMNKAGDGGDCVAIAFSPTGAAGQPGARLMSIPPAESTRASEGEEGACVVRQPD